MPVLCLENADVLRPFRRGCGLRCWIADPVGQSCSMGQPLGIFVLGPHRHMVGLPTLRGILGWRVVLAKVSLCGERVAAASLLDRQRKYHQQ